MRSAGSAHTEVVTGSLGRHSCGFSKQKDQNSPSEGAFETYGTHRRSLDIRPGIRKKSATCEQNEQGACRLAFEHGALAHGGAHRRSDSQVGRIISWIFDRGIIAAAAHMF